MTMFLALTLPSSLFDDSERESAHLGQDPPLHTAD